MEHNLLKLSAISDIITSEIKDIILKNGANVKIANVIVGEDISSLSYIRGMQKKAANVGITLEIVNLDKNIGEKDFFRKLEELNDSAEISGIIVQTPLPKHIDFSKISASIDFRKDLDGITFTNQGLLFSGRPFLIPATAWACDLTLQYI
nr:tetrahydrofolate dehydrogenase/cyclohydrolase catalytic domain-containing protein [Spirochaetota bacterium]